MANYTRMQYKTGQHALTPSEVKRLLLSFADVHEKAIIELGIAIGVRRADLAAIRRNNYNPEKKTITYYESKKKRDRTVFIPSDSAVQTLNMHLKTARKSEWLFPSPKLGKYEKKHISDRQIYDILNEHLDKIGVSRRPLHSLRATCYKLCQDKGWEPRKACELLGDTLNVAENHYNAPSVDEMKEISNTKELF